MSKKKVIFQVTLFQLFQITKESTILTEQNIRSPQIVRLLSYLICYRTRQVRTWELCEALWEEQELVNPVGAVKNLVYRARKLLEDTFGKSEYILSFPGGYCWNPKQSVCLDTERFEELYKAGNLEEMVHIYQGDFLKAHAQVQWIILLENHYHSMFLDCVCQLADEYLSAKQYHKAEELCLQAMKEDMLEETVHYHYIQSLLGQKKYNMAREYYEKAEKMLKKELGVQTLPLLQKIIYRKGDSYETKKKKKSNRTGLKHSSAYSHRAM